MLNRFIDGPIGRRFAHGFSRLWKGPDMQRARWTSGVLVILLIVLFTALLTRRGTVSAANDEVPSSSSRGGNQAAAQHPADISPAPGASTSAATPDPSSLRTIGTLTAAHFFQTYLNIGFIADGKAKGTYTNDDARKMLRSVLSLVDSVDRQLESLGQRTLDQEDCASLQQMRAISALLRQQGTELQTSWDNGHEDAARYESLRQDSYAAISKLMAIRP
jgi:hypothetical protein